MNNKTSQQIMRKVYLIWLFRQVFNRTTVKMATLAVLAWQVVAHVSIVHVMRNWSPIAFDLDRSLVFLEAAIVNTEPITIVALVGSAVMAVLLVRDMRPTSTIA